MTSEKGRTLVGRTDGQEFEGRTVVIRTDGRESKDGRLGYEPGVQRAADSVQVLKYVCTVHHHLRRCGLGTCVGVDWENMKTPNVVGKSASCRRWRIIVPSTPCSLSLNVVDTVDSSQIG